MATFTISSLTYDNMLAEAAQIAAKLLPQWNFSDQSDPVRYLIDLELRSIERGNWFANAMAQEFSLLTAVDRRSIVAHAKRLGYIPATRQPAFVTMQLNVTQSSTTQTILPYTAQVQTVALSGATPLTYENVTTIAVAPNTGPAVPAVLGVFAE